MVEKPGRKFSVEIFSVKLLDKFGLTLVEIFYLKCLVANVLMGNFW